jgi:hypothetical protein
VEHFLAQENINRDQLNETLIDDMAYHYYKNYYYYEMDNEFALRAAVSVVLAENNITVDGFEMWIP